MNDQTTLAGEVARAFREHGIAAARQPPEATTHSAIETLAGMLAWERYDSSASVKVVLNLSTVTRKYRPEHGAERIFSLGGLGEEGSVWHLKPGAAVVWHLEH